MANSLYGPDKIELPDIYAVYTPERQKQYPFAYISYAFLTKNYYLYCAKSELGIYVSSTGTGLIPRYDETAIAICTTAQNDGWGDFNEVEINSASGVWKPIWANTDVYYTKHSTDETIVGTLYLAASDPIPVGSADSKFDLYSWLTGYFLSIYGGFKK